MTERDARGPRVLHVVETLPLPASQTFILRRLNAARYAPSVIYYEDGSDGLRVPCPSRRIATGTRFGLPQRAPRISEALQRFQLRRVLTTAAPDVVHAHFGHIGCLVDRECRELNIPLVVSFYGYDVGRIPAERGILSEYQRMFSNAAVVTGEAPVLLQRLQELGARAEGLRLLPLCLPEWALAKPQRKISWDAKPFKMLQVARFVEKKGVDLSLKALALVRARGANVELDIVGDGGLDAELRELALRLGLGKEVRWRGFLPYERLPALLAETHVLIQPSRTAANGDTEGGHPTTLIEAAAQGVPVLGSTHADLPFVVQHEHTGLIAEENDVEQLAAHILRLASEPQTLAKMGEAARRRVLRRHDPDLILRFRERLYRRAVSRDQVGLS